MNHTGKRWVVPSVVANAPDATFRGTVKGGPAFIAVRALLSPGRSVTVNGKRQRVRGIDSAVVGGRVPNGRVVVRLNYLTPAIRSEWRVSLLVLLGCAVVAIKEVIRGFRRGRTRNANASSA